MKPCTLRLNRLVLLVGMLAALAGPVWAGPAKREVYVPNEYIIQVKQGSSRAAVEQSVSRMGASIISELPVPDSYLIRVGRVSSVGLVHGSRLAGQPFTWVIEKIQPNYRYYLHAIPNDEYWDKMWDMRLISMPGAWEVEKGDARIVVAVNDTGVANHPDLAGRLVAGYDFIDDDNDPSNDLVGHGTHVAGTIAAQGNNSIGIVGVCWDNVKIMPVRVFGTESTTSDILLKGEDYAFKNGAKVINMSYGGYWDDPIRRANYTTMANGGMVLVAAAGNDATDLPSYPAGYPEVISVSSVGPYDAIAYYSNYGKIEIAAPGGDSSLGRDALVWSTLATANDQGVITLGYGGMQGTSMACPHVAGAAALLLSYGVPAEEVRSRLMNSARPPKAGGMDPFKYGAGILDMRAALASASVRIVKPGKGSTVSGTPEFKISIQGLSTSSIRVYLDYSDLNDDGIPDNLSESQIINSANVNYFLNNTQTALEFKWQDPNLFLTQSAPLSAGPHNIYVTGNALAGGAQVADWAVFTVTNRKISRGIHLFSFPYALSNRLINTPSLILPGAKFGLGDFPRSTLVRWIAAPRSATDSTPIGYDTYLPGNAYGKVWANPSYILGGLSVPLGGGYYYDLITRQRVSSYPSGAGFWLVLPEDVWMDESFTPVESMPAFEDSKGYDIPLYVGWNMIGNPYAHSVPWRAALFTYKGQTKSLLDAETAGWVRSTLYGYGGAGTGYVRVADRDMLEPYCGYWLLSLVGGTSESDALVLNILP